jgi:hypothetical protein
MDEELLRQLIAQGGQIGEMDPEIERMKAMAEQARGRGAAPGMREARGIPVAASPLEHIGAFANNMVGMSKDRDASGMAQKQAGMRSSQAQNVLQALLKQKQAQANVPQGPGAGPESMGGVAQFLMGMGA